MAAPTTSTTGWSTGVVAALAGGALVVSGVIGAAVGVATAEGGGGTARQPVALHECPGEPPTGRLHSGDRVWLTGRSPDGDWLELRDPMDPSARRWVSAVVVEGDDPADDLPVVGECGPTVLLADDEPAPAEAPSVGDEPGEAPDEGPEQPDEDATPEEDLEELAAGGPDPTLPDGAPAIPVPGAPPAAAGAPPTTGAAPGRGPTPSPRPSPRPAPRPAPGPAPAPPPPTAPADPTIGPVNRSAAVIRENFPGACDTGLPTTSTVSTSASHPSGIASVQVRRRVGSAAWSGWQTVATSAGPVSFQVGPYAPGTAPAFGSAAVTWQLRVTSNAGTATTITSNPNQAVELRWCSLG